MIKKLMPWLFIAAMMLGCADVSAPVDCLTEATSASVTLAPENVFDKVVESTVTVRMLDDDGNQIGHGSGVCVDGRGTIITAKHVVDKGAALRVRFNDGREADVTDIYMSEAYDCAVIRVDATVYCWTTINFKWKTTLGEELIVCGTPLTMDLHNFVSRAYVASHVRAFSFGESLYLIQGSIYGGNSGGPVCDMSGKIVGIVVRGVYGTDISMIVPVAHIVRTFEGSAGL